MRRAGAASTVRELFRAALRLRPDRIIVGECRGGEALDMIQAMNSGHAGSLSTVHADDPARAMSRLETLCLMSDIEIPLIAVRRQVAEAIHLVVQVQRVRGRRIVTDIAEIGPKGTDGSGYDVRPIFTRPAPDHALQAVHRTGNDKPETGSPGRLVSVQRRGTAQTKGPQMSLEQLLLLGLGLAVATVLAPSALELPISSSKRSGT